MLKPEIDIEVIKSALLAGEADDAESWIRGAMRKIEIYRKVTKSDRYDSRYSFLEELQKCLSGEITVEEMKEAVEKIPGIHDTFVPEAEFDTFLNTFLYYLKYSVDRYNIKLPGFDGKRCDDR